MCAVVEGALDAGNAAQRIPETRVEHAETDEQTPRHINRADVPHEHQVRLRADARHADVCEPAGSFSRCSRHCGRRPEKEAPQTNPRHRRSRTHRGSVLVGDRQRAAVAADGSLRPAVGTGHPCGVERLRSPDGSSSLQLRRLRSVGGGVEPSVDSSGITSRTLVSTTRARRSPSTINGI